jgi:hypothetical protein
VIRQLVRELLQEDLTGFKSRTSDISYGRKDPKQLPRSLKSAWSAEADHEFFRGLTKIHWIAGGKKSPFQVDKKLSSILNASGKDEISVMGYQPGPIPPSEWGEFGLMVQGRTTLAASDMNAITSGYYRDVEIGMPAAQLSAYKKTSGLPRRASSFKPSAAESFILGPEDFGSKGLGNELVVDNWRPVGLVAPKWFLRDLKKSVPGTKVKGLEPSYMKLVELFVTSPLPVYDETGKPFDMSMLKAMWSSP